MSLTQEVANPAKASDYIIHIDGHNQSLDTFSGSETGTNVESESETIKLHWMH